MSPSLRELYEFRTHLQEERQKDKLKRPKRNDQEKMIKLIEQFKKDHSLGILEYQELIRCASIVLSSK
eukprot:Awhi_evm1s10372